MRFFYYFLFFLSVASGYAQTVTIDDTSRTPSQLAHVLLGDACLQISDVQLSSLNSVAYFNNNGGSFPLSEGIIIRSGKAKYAQGMYTGENMTSAENTNGDNFLQSLNAQSGQNQQITDAAFLEFEFTPLSSNFNFNFLFASNEYGEYQCVSSDVFAFVLTDLATGETRNLALIPNTDIPVSVKNIKDGKYQPGCQSVNAEYFDRLNVTDPQHSAINMRGYTTVLNAAAGISPGHHYKIKLVIGDALDTQYDSAIFIQAGSFDTNVSLGKDFTLCQGSDAILKTGLNASLYKHTWYKDGKELSETGSSLKVTQPGTYTVEVSQSNGGCQAQDKIVVSALQIKDPKDIAVCNSGDNSYIFNLNQNDANALNLDLKHYSLSYYASQNDLNAGNPIPSNQLNNFKSTGNQRIYIKIRDTKNNAACDAVYSFLLKVKDPITLKKPAPLELCTGSTTKKVDLTQNQSDLLPNEDASSFLFSYYTSLENAELGNNPIKNPKSYSVSTNTNDTSETIWIRVADKNDNKCYATSSFKVTLNPVPLVDHLDDVIECSEYILPPLTNGHYFTKANGKGNALSPGDVIRKGGTYYIFNGPNANGCTNQSHFKVILVNQYDVAEDHCGKFTVPIPPAGAFYTAPKGPHGRGSVIKPRTVLTKSQTIYYYAEIGGQVCRDTKININILPLPLVDNPENVIACAPYALPELAHGSYYTKSGGQGTKLNAGSEINASKTLYVYNDDGRCDNQYKYHIAIVPKFKDLTECGSYILPKLEVGGYYTAAGGMGDPIKEGTVIKESQTIYYFVQTTVGQNCSEDLSFKITILPLPKVDSLKDTLVCEDVGYELPPLTNGNYFTKSNRKGKKLAAGDIIGKTQTLYINNLGGGCSNESSFKVTVQPLPEVEIFADILQCDPYVLPKLKHGTYYTGPGATGKQLHAGDVIDSDVRQTIYIYNDADKLSSCYSETSFTVKINYIDLGEFNTVNSCDSYTLPPLKIGAYYSKTGGEHGDGERLYAGNILTKSQKVYVWAKKGGRFSCEFEKSFLVNISKTPELDPLKDVETCGSYTLPKLPQDKYAMDYYFAEGGNQKITPENYTITKPGTYTIYVQARAKNNALCTDEESFRLIIYPLRDFTVKNGILCRDPQTGDLTSPAHLESKMDANLFEVEWYFKGELVHKGINYDATQAGTYTVQTIKLDSGEKTPHSSLDCNFNPTTVEVTESSLPVFTTEASEDFRDVAVVTVNIVAGIGDFEYKIDNGYYQNSNEFYNVSSGPHTVYVRGIGNMCGVATMPVQVIKYPKFFTPNNDGMNDTWNISDLQNHPEAKVHIYDRYGKLLKTIMASGNGWKGTFNGKNMPSNDYWFQVNYQKDGMEHQFRSHFTLKR